MKNLTLLLLSTILLTSCATVQSIIKSTFPYTANLVVPADAKANTTLSAKSTATSIDQVVGNQNGISYVKDVRIASVKLNAFNPSNTNLGAFKSVKLFISSEGSGEIMVASRTDIQPNIGSNLVLDIDNSIQLDNYVRDSHFTVRLEYSLRNDTNAEINLKTTLSFTSTPKTT